MTLRRIVVTGGCGFLGQYVARDLAERVPDADVVVLDLKKNPHPAVDFSKLENVRVEIGVDLCREEGLDGLFDGTDLVVHAAGIVAFSVADRERLFRVHERGTQAVFEACRSAGVSRIVHVSSVAALGFSSSGSDRVDEGFSFDWRIAERKRKYYMLSKKAADRIATNHREDGLDARIVYPSLMYGPGDASNSVHVVRAIQSRRIPFVMPGGNATSDVRDVADGIVAVALQARPGEEYVLAAHNLTSGALFEQLAETLGVDPPRRKMPAAIGPALFHIFLLVELLVRRPITLSADSIDSAFRTRFFSSDKAHRDLGWSPRPFAETVRDAVTWLRSENLID